jgi:hypothetical protein
MALFRKKSSMPTREEALPGRAEPLKVPATHYVNSHRIVAPFPYQVRGRSRGQGERGKCILPTGVVEFAGDQRLCRWPLELSNGWSLVLESSRGLFSAGLPTCPGSRFPAIVRCPLHLLCIRAVG